MNGWGTSKNARASLSMEGGGHAAHSWVFCSAIFTTRRLTGATEDIEEGKRHNLDLVTMVHGVDTEREQTDNSEEVYDRIDGFWSAITGKGVHSKCQRQFKCQHIFCL